jgi:Flp pilus assembly protein TadG
MTRAQRKRSRRDRRGATIVEFALVVPFLFIIIFGVIDFSRAYSQLNAINAGLRESARFASVAREEDMATITSQVRVQILRTTAVWGYNSLDTTTVSVTLTPDASGTEYVTVTVTAHPVPLPVLGRFLGLSPFSLTRSVRYRWERAGGVT